jgi:hypothetical protein
VSADGDVGLLQADVRLLAQVITEAEVPPARNGEHNPAQHLTSRNGYRERRSRHPGRHEPPSSQRHFRSYGDPNRVRRARHIDVLAERIPAYCDACSA